VILPALALLLTSLTTPSTAAQPVLQRGYDANVSGADLSETTLNTSNVASGNFGMVFTLSVDDSIFAQPLYVPNVAIVGQGNHNVLYVATMSDSLYAFDADVGGSPLWSTNFAYPLGDRPVPSAQFQFSGSGTFVGNMGIVSTPVIDPSTNILYLVALTLENGNMVYRLHAVDITSGNEINAPGTVIAGSNNGVTFNARFVSQRVSLALADDQVVFGFGAIQNEYAGEGVGWVMAYDKQSLHQSGIFATQNVPGNGAGVWQSGRPPAVDSAGYVYVISGNAWGNGYDGVHNFSESFLKLDPTHGLNLVDWFTPDQWRSLDTNDDDLTSSGPMLVPGTNLVAGGGKEGVLYVLNTDNLGKFNSSDSQIVQEQYIAPFELHGGLVYWQRSSANGGPLMYDWAASDSLKAYPFNGSTFASSPSAQFGSQQNWPGGILTLSANGDQPGSGVLWVTLCISGDVQDYPPAPGALYAFDAANISHELWDSTMNAARDGFGNVGKFVPPVVANGKVYVGTWSNQVAVYGLLSTYTLMPTSLAFGSQATNTASAPMTVRVTNGGVVALSISGITISTPGTQPFSQTNNCGSSLAVGASCTISVVFKPGATGPTAATLSVNTSAGAGTQTVALSGTGVTPSDSVSPGSLSFGSQMINVASASMPVTVTNTASVTLPITSITLSTPGSQPFSQTNNCGSSVAVGGRCTINVVFNPASIGLTTATLSIAAGAGAGTQTVALNGTGVGPTDSVSPGSLSFGSQMINVASASQSVTVSNTGTVALPVTSITLSTAGSQPFSQTNNCGSSVAVGGSCTINVVFNPATAGSSGAMLSINTGAGAATVSLSGSGSFQVALTASANSATAGVPVTLTWVSAPGAACTPSGGSSGDGWSGTLAANGNQAVTEAAAGSYKFGLSCTLQAVSASASVTVAYTLPTVTLTASPTAITLGKPVTLTWASQNATSCVPGGGQSGDNWATTASAAQGTATVTPTAAGTVSYDMTCSAGSKSAEATATVTVTAPDPPAPASSGSGGGAFDAISLLSLLTMLGWRTAGGLPSRGRRFSRG